MKLFYRRYGKGEPLIIVHGLFGMSDNWIPIAKILSETFDVIVPDLRNHGQSPWGQSQTYSDMANDLDELISGLQIWKAHFVGHSMGGKAVMQFCLLFPDKVLSAIIVDIAPKNYAESNPEIMTFHTKLINHLIAKDISKAERRVEAENILCSDIRDERIRSLIVKNITRKADKKFAFKVNVEAVQKNFSEIGGYNAPVGKIFKGRCLFISGENSGYITMSDSKEILRLFPGAQIKTISNCGHWVHVDQPSVLSETLLCFLKNTEA
jgi:pimeloyl-ACP methyl ester carboxylesterase